MNELTTQWTYDLDEMSEDKSRPRVGTPPQKAFEIIGIDGNMNGGLRPISGFKQVAELDYYYDASTSDHSDVASAFQFNYTSEVIDFQPVNFRLNHKLKSDGSFETENKEGYAYGYVYRVKQSGKTTSVFIEYYDSLTGDWVTLLTPVIPVFLLLPQSLQTTMATVLLMPISPPKKVLSSL